MSDYYNDFAPDACAWLRELATDGHIPTGTIDERSIADVRADELTGYRRAHFFAGIGGWAEALRIADWPEWLPVWTGSPPCQPFSAAGKRGGRKDERHLGPAFVKLVAAGRPPVLFGEQVASSEAVGRASGPAKLRIGEAPAWAWCDDIFARLEAAGYAAVAGVVPAAGVGAPHIRQRLFFCAVDMRLAAGGLGNGIGTGRGKCIRDSGVSSGPSRPGSREAAERTGVHAGGMECAAGDGRIERGAESSGRGAASRCGLVGLADAAGSGHQPRPGNVRVRDANVGPRTSAGECGPVRPTDEGRPGPTDGFWRDADWLGCRDGKWRPVEPGTFPLAHGVPGRVGLLRGYGNAIVPQAAAVWVESCREVLEEAGIWQALEARFGVRLSEGVFA